MDWTPLIHAAIAVATQVLVGLVMGNWWLGGAMACAWWAAREHTQAEYRWIAKFAAGKRERMPWWGGFDVRAWDWPSVLDAGAPAAACLIFYLTAIEAVF
ncbi:MAG: hypothetical protein LBE51_13535 [Acidovorax sp.]|jgi:hypothetical protein|nr:hypothetical protein [Acidovorax sp.]